MGGAPVRSHTAHSPKSTTKYIAAVYAFEGEIDPNKLSTGHLITYVQGNANNAIAFEENKKAPR